MKKYNKKRGFMTIDLVVAIGVFAILSLAAISITVSYEKNIILSKKKQEMNFYIESIAKEAKYSMVDSEREKLKISSYINRANIEKSKIEKEKLVNLIDENIDDKNMYIEVKINDDNKLYIKYVNNKMGVNYSDVEEIKIA